MIFGAVHHHRGRLLIEQNTSRGLQDGYDRKAELARLIAETDEPPALLHPNMAGHYHKEVARLHEALNDPEHRYEAAEIIRGLVDRIVLSPLPEGSDTTMSIDLHGNLAAS